MRVRTFSSLVIAACALFLSLWLVISRAAVAEATLIPWPPVSCGNPCVIEDDAGGIVDTYAAWGRLMSLGSVPVIVDGPCMSACTIFVDLDRVNVCVTRRALLGYHMAARNGADGTLLVEPISYETTGLNAYIKARGGLPRPDSGHLLMLNFAEASQFYRPCAGAA